MADHELATSTLAVRMAARPAPTSTTPSWPDWVLRRAPPRRGQPARPPLLVDADEHGVEQAADKALRWMNVLPGSATPSTDGDLEPAPARAVRPIRRDRCARWWHRSGPWPTATISRHPTSTWASAPSSSPPACPQTRARPSSPWPAWPAGRRTTWRSSRAPAALPGPGHLLHHVDPRPTPLLIRSASYRWVTVIGGRSFTLSDEAGKRRRAQPSTG